MKKINKTKWKYGANNTILIVGVLLCVLLFNFVFSALAERYPLKVDVTSSGMYVLSDQTKEVLDGLEDSVVLYYICTETEKDEQLIEAMKMYDRTSDNVRVEIVDDVDRDPAFIRKYNIQSYGVLVLNETTEKTRFVNYLSLYEISTTGNATRVIASSAEGQLTAAISFVASADTPTVYYTQGHGEVEDFTAIANNLSSENIDAKPVNLLTEDIPAEADLVMIVGPTMEFEAESIAKLDTYIELGGAVQYYSSVSYAPTALLDYFNDTFGMQLEADLTVEEDAQYMVNKVSSTSFQVPYMLAQVQEHEITQPVTSQNGNILWPQTYANSITVTELEGVEVTPLLTTSPKGGTYGITALSQAETDLPPKSKEGEVVLMAYGRRNPLNNQEKTAKLLMVGCYSSLYETASETYMNKELVTRSINYMAGFEAAPVLISPKPMDNEELTVSYGELQLYGVLLIGIIPLALLGYGIFVWLKRRHL